MKFLYAAAMLLALLGFAVSVILAYGGGTQTVLAIACGILCVLAGGFAATLLDHDDTTEG